MDHPGRPTGAAARFFRRQLAVALVAGLVAAHLAAFQERLSDSRGRLSASQANLSSSREGVDRRQALGLLELQLAELRGKLDRVSAQADDLVGRVARVRAELQVQRVRLEQAQEALSLAMDSVSESERELAALEESRARLVDQLGARASSLYRLGRWGRVRLLLGLASHRDPLPGLRLLRYLVGRDVTALASIEANRAEINRTATLLEERRTAARSWLDQQRRQTAAVEAQSRVERATLVELAKRREGIGKEISGLTGRRDRVDRLLDILASEGPSGLGGLAIQEFKGALDRPVRGRLGRGFGPYRDPKYGTLVPHNGQVIHPSPGSEVRVVYPGRVVFSGQLKDVGLVAVVQHREQSLTLYSGLRDVEVGEGDILSLGDRIGWSGDELYFEIRLNRVAQDPRAWWN